MYAHITLTLLSSLSLHPKQIRNQNKNKKDAEQNKTRGKKMLYSVITEKTTGSLQQMQLGDLSLDVNLALRFAGWNAMAGTKQTRARTKFPDPSLPLKVYPSAIGNASFNYSRL